MSHEDAPERALSLLSRINSSCYAAVKANAFSYRNQSHWSRFEKLYQSYNRLES